MVSNYTINSLIITNSMTRHKINDNSLIRVRLNSSLISRQSENILSVIIKLINHRKVRIIMNSKQSASLVTNLNFPKIYRIRVKMNIIPLTLPNALKNHLISSRTIYLIMSNTSQTNHLRLISYTNGHFILSCYLPIITVQGKTIVFKIVVFYLKYVKSGRNLRTILYYYLSCLIISHQFAIKLNSLLINTQIRVLTNSRNLSNSRLLLTNVQNQFFCYSYSLLRSKLKSQLNLSFCWNQTNIGTCRYCLSQYLKIYFIGIWII